MIIEITKDNEIVFMAEIKFNEKEKKYIIKVINDKTKYFSYKYLASAIINGKYYRKDLKEDKVCDTSEGNTIEERINIFNQCGEEGIAKLYKDNEIINNKKRIIKKNNK